MAETRGKCVCEYRRHDWCPDRRKLVVCAHARPHKRSKSCKTKNPCVCWGIINLADGHDEWLVGKCVAGR